MVQLILGSQLLYSRLLTFKVLAAKLASDPSSPYLQNPVAAELALLDTEPPNQRLAELTKSASPASHFYTHMLESCEKLFDNQIDQQTFEDIVRYMFGTKVDIVIFDVWRPLY